MSWAAEPVRVQVPATSANLGPGFDALGLALSLHDEVEARILPAGVSIEITGEGADLAGAGEEHLVLRAMRETFALTGGQPAGLGLRCLNRIPHGRGLGSSAAAIVAGVLAAHALAGPDKALSGPELLALASRIEGHPDNVAACLGGGLTIAWLTPDGPRMIALAPLPSLAPVLCVAPGPVRTAVVRGLLPGQVPHRDAAANAGRSALLIAALTQPGLGREVLLEATRDWLHQDYRASAMPATHELVRGLREAGLPAVVSGAGPSVLAFLDASAEGDHRHDLAQVGSIAKETGISWHVSSLDVERLGARVLHPVSPPGC